MEKASGGFSFPRLAFFFSFLLVHVVVELGSAVPNLGIASVDGSERLALDGIARAGTAVDHPAVIAHVCDFIPVHAVSVVGWSLDSLDFLGPDG